MSSTNPLSIVHAASDSMERIWMQARRKGSAKIPVVAMSTDFGDLLVIRRADLADVARHAAALNSELGRL